jgi:dienelactone hydrolase
MRNEIGFSASENPFVVEHGGFYRRWIPMLDNLEELTSVVKTITTTTEDVWIPIWKEAGLEHENIAERLLEKNKVKEACKELLIAKTYYSIARYPGEITENKSKISAECARVYREACNYMSPQTKIIDIKCEGKSIRCHFRIPKSSTKIPAVLIMCGSDMFKEDRGWASEYAVKNGMAALVMDGPGTGENPFPWDPESVKAWMAAIDYLASRDDIDENRIGAFGISRGGYSVMQLAGTYPEKIKAVVANAGHPFGYEMSEDELIAFVEARNQRAQYVFGKIGDPPSFPSWSIEKEKVIFEKWSLSKLGVIDKITQPLLMINGKKDHLAPIGNIYYMLEHGPVTGREVRIYPDAGHCAFKYFDDWAPASFEWLASKL